MQSGRHCRSAVATGHALIIEHAEVPDQRLEPGPEPGGRDDRVGAQHCLVIELNAIGVDRRHTGDDLDLPAPDRLDHIGIDDRRLRASAESGKGSLLREGESPKGRDQRRLR
jgi:hypothetical protein